MEEEEEAQLQLAPSPPYRLTFLPSSPRCILAAVRNANRIASARENMFSEGILSLHTCV